MTKQKKLKSGFDHYKGKLRYRFSIEGNRYAVYGDSTKECEKKRDEIRDKIAKGLLIHKDVLTLHKYYDEWQQRRVGQIKESTRYADDRRFKNIDKAIGEMKLKDITRRHVFLLQGELRERLSTKGVNDTMSLLRSIMKSAADDRIIPYNPTDGVKALKRTEEEAEKGTHRYLTDAELELFFPHAKGTFYYNLFRFLLLTGMRPGEACALTWGDIDRDANVVKIHRTITKVGDHNLQVSNTPKNEGSRRDIELTNEMKAVLYDQKLMMSELFGFRALDLDKQIFTTQRGGLIGPENTSSTIAHICKKVGVKRFTAHAFRHTFISYEIAAGVLPNVIAAQVGHNNELTLAKYYSHEDPEKYKEAFRLTSADRSRLYAVG